MASLPSPALTMPVVPRNVSSASLFGFSCLACRQRKLKCDRKSPCSRCIRADQPCKYVAPVRGKRKKRTGQNKQSLRARLRKCEELLQQHGVQFDLCPSGSEENGDSDLAMASDAGDDSTAINAFEEELEFTDDRPRLVAGDVGLRYYDGYVQSTRIVSRQTRSFG
jgi:hypothetical protein